MGVEVTGVYFCLFGVKIQSFSNIGKSFTKMKLWQIIYENDAHAPVITKNVFRGHPRSPDPVVENFHSAKLAIMENGLFYL